MGRRRREPRIQEKKKMMMNRWLLIGYLLDGVISGGMNQTGTTNLSSFPPQFHIPVKGLKIRTRFIVGSV
jgi:hypothetical protein